MTGRQKNNHWGEGAPSLNICPMPNFLLSPLDIVLSNMAPPGSEIREAMERGGRGSQQIPPQ